MEEQRRVRFLLLLVTECTFFFIPLPIHFKGYLQIHDAESPYFALPLLFMKQHWEIH